MVSMLLYTRGPLWLSVVCPFSAAQGSFCSHGVLTPLLLLLRDLLFSLLWLAPAEQKKRYTCSSYKCELPEDFKNYRAVSGVVKECISENLYRCNGRVSVLLEVHFLCTKHYSCLTRDIHSLFALVLHS